MANVYVGLGANIDHPIDHVTRAIGELDTLPATELAAHSSLYQTSPHGPPNQPDFVNAVALLRTALEPLALLGHLLNQERRHHRVRLQRWGRRTLDLDILLYDHISVHLPRLTIPHPRLHQRSFVLIPLHELNPDLAIPGKGKLKNLVARLPSGHEHGIRKMANRLPAR